MGVLVLNPHDVLKNPITSRQALISPPAARPRFPRNQIPSRSTRAQQPNQRKRSPNTSPPARATTVGDVRILKRGEQLAVTTQQPKEEAPSKPDLGSSARFGPDPVSIRIRVAKPKNLNGFYAGSAFFTSPPPSSLPLPVFFMMKKNDDVVVAADETDAVASSELRKLLGLQLQ